MSFDNCGQLRGGWWHNRCSVVQVNDDDNTIIHINGEWHAPELLEIKIRPCDCIKND